MLVLALPNICLDEVRELTPNIQRIEFQVLSTPTLLISYAFTEGVPESLSTTDIISKIFTFGKFQNRYSMQNLDESFILYTCLDYQPGMYRL